MADTLGLLLILLVVFLVCREIMTWYWKMNETVKLLKEIRDEIKAVRDPDFNPKAKKFNGLLRG